MTAIYGASLAVGFVALIVWIAATVSAGSTGRRAFDPETRFGGRGRLVVAVLFGFGMAGLSASYAGWGTLLSVVAAAVGAAALAAVARWFGPQPTE